LKKSLRLSTLVILCLTLAAIPVYSEEHIDLQLIEVSASRLKTAAQRHTDSITIITEKEIKHSDQYFNKNPYKITLGECSGSYSSMSIIVLQNIL
jgi:outer membrane receptor for ferrienterochelin and colicin